MFCFTVYPEGKLIQLPEQESIEWWLHKNYGNTFSMAALAQLYSLTETILQMPAHSQEILNSPEFINYLNPNFLSTIYNINYIIRNLLNTCPKDATFISCPDSKGEI